jgi:hypothetical protein
MPLARSVRRGPKPQRATRGYAYDFYDQLAATTPTWFFRSGPLRPTAVLKCPSRLPAGAASIVQLYIAHRSLLQQPSIEMLTPEQRAELEHLGAAYIPVQADTVRRRSHRVDWRFQVREITRGDIEDWLAEKSAEESASAKGVLDPKKWPRHWKRVLQAFVGKPYSLAREPKATIVSALNLPNQNNARWSPTRVAVTVPGGQRPLVMVSTKKT